MNRLTPTALGYCSAMLIVGAALVALWLTLRRGPSHVGYGLMVAAWTFALGPGIAGVIG